MKFRPYLKWLVAMILGLIFTGGLVFFMIFGFGMKQNAKGQYASMALAAIAHPTLRNFPSKIVKSEATGGYTRRVWLDTGQTCLKTRRTRTQTSPNGSVIQGGTIEMSGPSCEDFHIGTDKDTETVTYMPAECRPLLSIISNGYVVIVVAGDPVMLPIKDRSATSEVSAFFQSAEFALAEAKYSRKLVDHGGLDHVRFEQTGILRCEGFTIQHLDVEITNFKKLQETIPVGLK